MSSPSACLMISVHRHLVLRGASALRTLLEACVHVGTVGQETLPSRVSVEASRRGCWQPAVSGLAINENVAAEPHRGSLSYAFHIEAGHRVGRTVPSGAVPFGGAPACHRVTPNCHVGSSGPNRPLRPSSSTHQVWSGGRTRAQRGWPLASVNPKRPTSRRPGDIASLMICVGVSGNRSLPPRKSLKVLSPGTSPHARPTCWSMRGPARRSGKVDATVGLRR